MITIGQTVVEVRATQPVTVAAPPPPPSSQEEQARLAAVLERLARLRARVRAEGFDD
ncbi:MAG: hypothetical protein AMXMBFR34_08000 [Myxococcaceae bacterium]